MTVFFIREFTVRKHERGLLFKDGDFVRFLAPAAYRFFDPHRRIEIERFDLSQPAFEHRLVDYLVRWHSEAIEDLFLRVETGADQIAVVTKNGHPWTVVAPERRALFWKGVVHVKAQLFDLTSEIAVEPRIAKAIAAAALATLRLARLGDGLGGFGLVLVDLRLGSLELLDGFDFRGGFGGLVHEAPRVTRSRDGRLSR
jgi:hypothetical protein